MGKPHLELPKAPRAPVADESKARRFVEGAEAKRRGRPRKPEGSKSATWERLTVYLPVETATELRVHAARERLELSDVVAEAVATWFRQRN